MTEAIVFEIIMELCRKLQFDEARSVWSKFTTDEGVNSRRMIWLANIEGLSGNHEGEYDALNRAIICDGRNASAHYSMCRNRVKSTNYEEAKASARKVIEIEEVTYNKPFTDSARFLLLYANLKSNDQVSFKRNIDLLSDDADEWVDGQLQSKKTLLKLAESLDW